MAELIEVISSCVVGTRSNIWMSRIELNPWDLRLLGTTYTQRGLIFHNPPSQQTHLITHLKNSLSRTLDFFPPLAGRLATTAHHGDMSRFFVDCNNAGAEFNHAVAPAVSVSDILGPNYTPLNSPLFALTGVNNIEGISTPLLGVQVTELADGIFIGCTTNHAVIDGTSFWHLINSWSQISRGSDTISKLPVLERWFPTNLGDDIRLVHLPTLKQNLFHPPSPPPHQKVFHFTRESLGKLKAKANSEAGSDKISTLQAVVAHLWRGTTRCGCGNESTTREAVLAMAIGARARLGLADGYFGNACFVGRIAMSEGELLQKGLGHAALKINDFISQQTTEVIIRNAEEHVALRRDWPYDLIVGSSPRFDVYGNDFGWGSPIGVRSGIKGVGLVRASQAAQAGGMELEVYLAKETLQALECDTEFMGAF